MKTLAKSSDERKRRFKAALALAGLKQWQFAQMNGLSSPYLSQILDGTRNDDALLEKVDEFTRIELAKVTKLTA